MIFFDEIKKMFPQIPQPYSIMEFDGFPEATYFSNETYSGWIGKIDNRYFGNAVKNNDIMNQVQIYLKLKDDAKITLKRYAA